MPPASPPTLPPHLISKRLFFALRELTGSDPGPKVQDWKQHFLEHGFTIKTTFIGFKSASGLAVDGDGRAFIRDDGHILRKEPAGQPLVWRDGAGSGLALDAEGRLLAAHGKTAQVVRIHPANGEMKALADRSFNGPRRLAPDSKGGLWFTDSPGSEKKAEGAVFYISAHGSVTRFSVAFSHPSGLGSVARWQDALRRLGDFVGRLVSIPSSPPARSARVRSSVRQRWRP